MLARLLFALILCFVALALLLTGYLIRYRGYHSLIAGFDPARVSDPDGLARFVGGTSIALGCALLVGAAFAYAAPQFHWLVGILVGVLAVGGTAVTVAGCSRFARR